jgi:hypothetical protein
VGRAATQPLEWLLTLCGGDGLERLLADAGSLAAAAWHLARARCLTREHATSIPSAREVRGAAREIAQKTGRAETPSAAALARECELVGLPVL